ncbi:ribbon-helix-helix protein, CopG family [Bosea sp. (in: a-proteobacteria)]|uniref:ribbon-helix-helix protein, CopG family n=1 Tax=Bosea sp. (in: a-proteobacteria) TaxID=1871050 RepID=UPI003525ADFE
MESQNQRIRVEILCEPDLVKRLQSITACTGVSRNFLVRKAIRLYLDNRDRLAVNHTPAR